MRRTIALSLMMLFSWMLIAPLHHAHHTVMLAASAAARRETCVGVGGKERRDQHPAEQHHQRKCDRAPHCQRTFYL
jgi:hypothetical protein